MRSPGARRIIHTRTLSVSDTSVLPTQGLGFFFSRSNSAAMSAGQGERSDFSVALSSMVRAMAFLLRLVRYIATFARRETADRLLEQRGQTARPHRRRLDERPARGAAAAAGGLGGRR